MNLGHHHHKNDHFVNESEDLVEQACHHLSRGRNDDALHILTEALQHTKEQVNDAKQKMDKFYLQKKLGHSNNDNNDHIPNHEEDELEDKTPPSAPPPPQWPTSSTTSESSTK